MTRVPRSSRRRRRFRPGRRHGEAQGVTDAGIPTLVPRLHRRRRRHHGRLRPGPEGTPTRASTSHGGSSPSTGPGRHPARLHPSAAQGGVGPTWVAGTPTGTTPRSTRPTTAAAPTIAMVSDRRLNGRENPWATPAGGNNFTMRYCEATARSDGSAVWLARTDGPTSWRTAASTTGYIATWTRLRSLPTSRQARPTDAPHPQRRGADPGVLGLHDPRKLHRRRSRKLGVTSVDEAGNRDYLNPSHQPVIAAVDAADDYGGLMHPDPASIGRWTPRGPHREQLAGRRRLPSTCSVTTPPTPGRRRHRAEQPLHQNASPVRTATALHAIHKAGLRAIDRQRVGRRPASAVTVNTFRSAVLRTIPAGDF